MKEYYEKRNRDFRKAALEIAQRYHLRHPKKQLSLGELAVMTMMHPAPHFYLTYPYALRTLGQIDRGEKLHVSRSTRSQFAELGRRTKSFLERNPGSSMGYAVQQVLTSGKAPCFYMSVVTARRILTQQH